MIGSFPAILNADNALKILKQTDVRDAMSFSVETGNDARVEIISRVMQDDAIWRYWFKRDLKIISDRLAYKLGGSLWINKAVGGPLWKIAYLWGRLLVSTMQYLFFRLHGDSLSSIYSPNCVIKFYQLNTFTVTVNGSKYAPVFPPEVLHMDIRVQWKRLVAKLNAKVYDDGPYNFVALVRNSRTNPDNTRIRNWSQSLLVDKYHLDESSPLTNANTYRNGLQNILTWLWDTSAGTSIDDKSLQVVSSIPRLIERTKVLLANRICSNCESTSNVGYRCGDCFVEPTFYCSSKCQDAEWETHVCKQ